MSDQYQRKLTSIFAADVVGYSAMMAEDETGTINAVRALKNDLIEPIVQSHSGRIVKTMGDGFLIDFPSVVDSVEAGIALQNKLSDAEGEPLNDKSIALRIGIHLGDIVIDDGDIFGDGVNIAARIEPLAQSGGISLSDEAYRQVRDKVDVTWADGGEHTVKNMNRPIRVWHWENGKTLPAKDPELNLPDLPSVAVLPFDNMSSDGEQDYFADGLTEDLITDLSKISGLFVVARNSTFVFKGQAIDIPTIGRRLGVANVIEGSVRKLGQRVRINVQLIDAKTGGHVWADRYDGTLDEVFELQDLVCNAVVDAMSVKLSKSETKRLGTIHTTDIDAYELFVKAKSTPYPPIPARMAAANELFKQTVQKAPDFAGGYAGQAWIVGFGALWGHEDPQPIGLRAEALAYKAISLDPEFGWSQTVLSLALLAQRRFDEAQQAAEKGLLLLPGDADAHVFSAIVNGVRGNFAAAVDAAEAAFRLSPNFVNGPYLNVIAHANFMAGNHHAALAAYEQNVARGGPVGPPALCWAAACYHATGQADKASMTLQDLTAGFPQFRLSNWNFIKLIETEHTRRVIESSFRDAGLPF
ncbi:adenylate/guanylate cyclase domain-containing protein [Ruegeria sp. HKCCD7255]|uniref:adenylate/guanylate cyclase domain-containing protein n=1 Tax=Ruegeria sp. HKCCD7255 TaxID=2683004 RepID=UPI00148783A9|nr:adenylate/guanylate cyclase domain-containing protein [Ruegeria sp. HKCCD7255]